MEPATFEELYSNFGRDVYRFALYLCGDASRAEDLTAETFLRVWTSPIPVRLPTVKSYLLTITRNLVAEEARRRRPTAMLDQRIAAGGSLERETAARNDLAAVRRAMETLPEDSRMALLLKTEGGLSYEEIAAVMEISSVSARVKVHRARLELRRALA
jgi:RNA polymerase sigma-70 factor (ECF subfamily)